MKIGVIISYPSQLDVPIYSLGKNVIEVIYTDEKKSNSITDSEINRVVDWSTHTELAHSNTILKGKNKRFKLMRLIYNANYDMLITSGYSARFSKTALICGKLFARQNAMRLDTVDLDNTSVKQLVIKRIIYFVINIFVSRFFVTGKRSGNFLKSVKIDEKKISTYGYVIDNKTFASATTDNHNNTSLKHRLGIMEGTKAILCVSKHSIREAPFDTINAFALMSRNDCHLLLVGDGPIHDEVVALTRKLGITSQVTFAGYVEYKDLPGYYAIADLFVHDSKREPWGVSVQEALASNLPVITSHMVGSAYDLIIEGKNGFIYNVGDVDDLKSKIEEALLFKRSEVKLVNDPILVNWTYSSVLDSILDASAAR